MKLKKPAKLKRVNLLGRKLFGRKAVVFSIMIFLLFFPIFSFAGLYRNFTAEKQEYVGLSNSQMNYFEDDVLSNAFFELTGMKVSNITRTASDLTLSFGDIFFNTTSDSAAQNIQRYVSFAETNYSSMSNINISLRGFNSSFTIEPYGTFVSIGSSNISFFTMQNSTNYVQSASFIIQAFKKRTGSCAAPNNDAGYMPVEVTFVDVDGWTCTQSQTLNPCEDNDRTAANEQFVINFNDGTYAEVKYGLINGQCGVFQLDGPGLIVNVTALNIVYTPLAQSLTISAGNITIRDALTNKTISSGIALAQE